MKRALAVAALWLCLLLAHGCSQAPEREPITDTQSWTAQLRHVHAQVDTALAQGELERRKCLEEGESWLRGRLQLLDQLIKRGDRSGAEKDLSQIERWSMLPEWASLVNETREHLGLAR